MTIKPGEEAKDFILSDQDGKEVHLSDFKGKKVLLSFHPLAWTPVCADQMRSLEKNRSRFERLNIRSFFLISGLMETLQSYTACSGKTTVFRKEQT